MAKKPPLIDAVQRSDYASVEQLLLENASQDVADEEGYTPLLWACQNGELEIVKLLLRHGADINACDHEGYSPVEVAINNQQVLIAEFLISSGCDISVQHDGFTLMHGAAATGFITLGQLLAEKGVAVDSTDDSGRMPLHWAVQENCKDFIAWLISESVPLNVEDSCAHTPLFMAVGEGHTEIVHLLLAHGVAVNYRNAQGTALHFAFAWNRSEIIALLDSLGANFVLTDDEENYPICFALDNGYTQLTRQYYGKYLQIAQQLGLPIPDATPCKIKLMLKAICRHARRSVNG